MEDRFPMLLRTFGNPLFNGEKTMWHDSKFLSADGGKAEAGSSRRDSGARSLERLVRRRSWRAHFVESI